MDKKFTGKRILFITDNGGCLGGAEKSMFTLIKMLIGRGHKVYCLMSGKGDFYTALKEMGVVCEIFKMPAVERTKNPLVLLWFIFYLVCFGSIFTVWSKLKKINIIHVNKTPSVFYGIAISLLSLIPVVWHVRSYNRNFGLIGKIVHNFVDAVVCISQDMAEPFMDFFGDKKIYVVYNGVFMQPLKKVSKKTGVLRNELKISNNSFVAGMVTRITPSKKIEVFLEAFNVISKQKISSSHIHGVIIGDCVTAKNKQMSTDICYKENMMKLYNEMNIKNYVSFIGYKNEPEKYIADMDALVLPSRDEPFGRVLIEAMALGVPVIAADTGGMPEIIDDKEDGFLVPLDNADELAQAILNLSNNPLLRKRIAKSGWGKVNKRFSAKIYTDNIEKIYKKVLEL